LIFPRYHSFFSWERIGYWLLKSPNLAKGKKAFRKVVAPMNSAVWKAKALSIQPSREETIL
jgi:hypothetical protein